MDEHPVDLIDGSRLSVKTDVFVPCGQIFLVQYGHPAFIGQYLNGLSQIQGTVIRIGWDVDQGVALFHVFVGQAVAFASEYQSAIGMFTCEDIVCKLSRCKNWRRKFPKPGGKGCRKVAIFKSFFQRFDDKGIFKYILCATGKCDGFFLFQDISKTGLDKNKPGKPIVLMALAAAPTLPG